jgi:hypothetical protein
MTMQPFLLGLLRISALVMLALTSGVGYTQQPKIPPAFKASPLYVAQLPKFCWQQYVDGSLSRAPFAIVNCGGGMNHFCPALVFLLQAQNVSLSRNERVGAIKHAVTEIDYTIREMTQGCSIASDVYAAKEKARALSTVIK